MESVAAASVSWLSDSIEIFFSADFTLDLQASRCGASWLYDCMYCMNNTLQHTQL